MDEQMIIWMNEWRLNEWMEIAIDLNWQDSAGLKICVHQIVLVQVFYTAQHVVDMLL